MDSMIYGKPLKFWIFIGSITILVLAIFSLLSSYSLYRISVQGGDNYSVQAVTQGNSERHDIQTIFGISLVPRDVSFIEVSQGRSMARASLTDKKILGITDRLITLRPQKAVSKHGRNSLGCNISNSTGVYSYNCGEPDKIIAFGDLTRSQWDNSVERNLLPDSFYYVPYRDGLLSMGYVTTDEGDVADSLRLEYIIPGNSQTEAVTVSGVKFNPDDILTLHSDTSSGNSFVISNLNSGSVFYFSDLNASVKTLGRKATYNRTSDVASCSLRQTLFSCYYGFSSQSPDGIEEKNARADTLIKRKGTGQIETYDFSKNSSRVSTIKETVMDEVCVTKENTVIGASATDIIYLDTQPSTTKVHLLADNGFRVSCGDSSIYTTEKGIYEVNGNTSHLLFSVNHLNISGVSAFGKNIVFNAFIDAPETDVSDPTAHTYSVNLTKDHLGSRIEDILPYAINSGLPILDMDYNDTTLYIQPSYGIISDRQTGQVIVDEESFNASRSVIENNLRADSVLDTGRRIVFSAD